jgi:hypothetical protein
MLHANDNEQDEDEAADDDEGGCVHARARRWAPPLQESFYIDTNKTRVPRECEMNSGAAMGKLCVRSFAS